MKFLIAGRTGSGKDTLANKLKEKGLTTVKSYTTRPKRSDTEDTHIFISQEKADAIPADEKVARTVIGNYEYFATKQQVMDADTYVIDPDGIQMLLEKMPDETFCIIYCKAKDDELRRKAALNRTENPEKEASILAQRETAEDARFTAFEQSLDIGNFGRDPNCLMMLSFINDYTDASLDQIVYQIESAIRYMSNMRTVVRLLVEKGSIITKNKKLALWKNTKTGGCIMDYLSEEQFTQAVIRDDAGVAQIIRNAFSMPDVRISIEKGQKQQKNNLRGRGG